MRRLALPVFCVAVLAACGQTQTHTCQAGSPCGGLCVDFQTDPANCGGCGFPCGPGELCAQGACVLSCPEDLAECDGSCRDLATDRAHCGRCGKVCQPGELCFEGACTLSCPLALADCGGSCRDLGTDRANCGACGAACGSGEVCLGGRCVVSCPAGETECDGLCRDLAADPAHCGACGAACEPGHACEDGRCVLSCPADLAACADGCRDTSVDPDHCGACGTACVAPAVCRDGTCTLACPEPLSGCGGKCVDLATDLNNCGSCGRPCAPGTVCSGGACKAWCDPTFAACGSRCADLAHDPAHCGSCEHACPSATRATMACLGGACTVGRCDTGFADCDGLADTGCEVDARADVSNCGVCGNTCWNVAHGAATCAAGRCGFTCLAGYGDCNGSPLDGCETSLRADPMNCGGCGTSCAGILHATATCVDSGCHIGTCNAGYKSCDGQEWNGCETAVATDPNNCGNCATVCPTRANSNPACAAGVCGVACRTGYGNCNSSLLDGCEAILTSDNRNCGACGTVCSGGRTCQAGICRY